MKIRQATVGDFLAIADLDRHAWLKYPQAEFIPDGEHAWRLWVEHGLVYCAEDSDRIIGAIAAFPTAYGQYCVHKAFVEELRRGQGIGTALFQALLGELDHIGAEAFLAVNPENAAAVRLYERWGFTERRFVEGYYRPSEHRYVLTRRRSATKDA